MDIRTIEWRNDAIRIIDQTKLPGKLRYLRIDNLRNLREAITKLKVRGAPALGAAAALGVCLGIKDFKRSDFSLFLKKLDEVIRFIGSSRPTANNLFWGLERIRSAALKNKNRPIKKIKDEIFKEANNIIEEDRISSRRIGYFGAKLLSNCDTILTICNAGILATIDYGTALGVIYRAKEEGKKIKVFACETRPLMQGARLTTWELQRKGIDVTLICDNTVAALMKGGSIDKVVVGADRIAANGDTANKIGTLGLAIVSKYHNVPFYVAAPFSTFDLGINCGGKIPIEERHHREVTGFFFDDWARLKRVNIFNPAFDVTPHNLITAIITDRGIINPPFIRNIKKTYAAKRYR